MRVKRIPPFGGVSYRNGRFGTHSPTLCLLVLLSLMVGLSCDTSETAGPTLALPTAQFEIYAALGSGESQFYFLPPMVASADYAGDFDSELDPLVTIRPADGGPPITTLSSNTEPTWGLRSVEVYV